MSTSVHQGRLLTGRTWDAQAAVDASFVRDVVQNSLCHFADEFAQVRVCFAGSYFSQETPIEYDVWKPIASFGPFPLALRQSGDGYKLRIRVAGANGDDGTASGKLRVVICPAAEADSLVNVDEDFVFETQTLTTTLTPTWLTGTSQGTAALSTLVTIPGSVAAGWITTTSTVDDIAGNAVGVEQCLVYANVYAYSDVSDDTDTPGIELVGLYLAEYIGT
jgi:hypothetical protein